MKIHRNITILIFINFLQSHLFAQTVSHLNFWSRLSISQPISEKWKVEAEFQHRRQNDYAMQSVDFFQENLLNSFRTWVHYQHKDDIGFSFSPFAYYWHNSIIISEADREKPQQNELRFSAAVDLKHEVVKKLWLIDRSCFEYRQFKQPNTDFIRVRNRLGLRYEFNSKWNITLFDELFLHVKGAAPSHIFDHDRLAALINYKPSKNIRFETGYMYISRLPRNTEELLHENNFLMHVYFTLPHASSHHHSNHQKHS